MFKKLFLVYNPRSSHYARVQAEVLVPARQLNGWMVGKYEIKATSFEDNVKKIAQLLSDGALVIAVGGDGTATMVINAILESGKDVVFAAIGYGNFNDIATMLSATELDDSEGLIKIVKLYEDQQIRVLYPISIDIDEKHWRYAPAYCSIGLMAEATRLVEDAKTRKKLQTGRKGPLFTLRMAVKWYMKNHKRSFMPAGKLNGRDFSERMTDYLAVNSPMVAEIMKGGDWWRESNNFGSTLRGLGKFWAMVSFGLTSVFKKIPLAKTQRDVLSFERPANIEIQTEGEFAHLENIQEIKIQKAEKALRVITGEVDSMSSKNVKKNYKVIKD